MPNAHPRFVDFIKRCVAALELPAPNVVEDRYMFEVGGRWIELKYHPGDDRVTIVSLAYIREPDAQLRADLIGGFNCYNLFNGGYTLVPMEGALVYLCQPHLGSRRSIRPISGRDWSFS